MAYGAVEFDFPSEDADGNGFPDFLQKENGGEWQFNGTAKEHFDATGATSDVEISGRLVRAAGETEGTYSGTFTSEGEDFDFAGVFGIAAMAPSMNSR